MAGSPVPPPSDPEAKKAVEDAQRAADEAKEAVGKLIDRPNKK